MYKNVEYAQDELYATGFQPTGVDIITSAESISEVVSGFELSQNYPNPFNPTTQILYGIPEASEVELVVFNMLGQKVATLVNGKQSAGWHTAIFDASGLSSGFYIYRIQAGEFVSTKKLMLIK
ncbi:MAG: T9SS type A sorting domain-containing protein [Balneolaceae bacterium]